MICVFQMAPSRRTVFASAGVKTDTGYDRQIQMVAGARSFLKSALTTNIRLTVSLRGQNENTATRPSSS